MRNTLRPLTREEVGLTLAGDASAPTPRRSSARSSQKGPPAAVNTTEIVSPTNAQMPPNSKENTVLASRAPKRNLRGGGGGASMGMPLQDASRRGRGDRQSKG